MYLAWSIYGLYLEQDPEIFQFNVIDVDEVFDALNPSCTFVHLLDVDEIFEGNCNLSFFGNYADAINWIAMFVDIPGKEVHKKIEEQNQLLFITSDKHQVNYSKLKTANKHTEFQNPDQGIAWEQ